MDKTTVLFLLVALVASSGLALAEPTATATAANSSAGEGTPPAKDSSTERVTIGPTAYITGWSFEDGTLTVTIESEVYQQLTVSSAPDQSSGAGTGTIDRFTLRDGENTIRFPLQLTDGDATANFVTSNSLRANTYAYVTVDRSSPFIGGPYGSSDITYAAGGAAVGTGFGALVVVIRRQLGLHRGMERVA